jgi:hypothetical protein
MENINSSDSRKETKPTSFSFAINDRYGPTGYTFADFKFLASVVASYTGGMLFLQNVSPRLIPSGLSSLTRFFGALSKSSMISSNPIYSVNHCTSFVQFLFSCRIFISYFIDVLKFSFSRPHSPEQLEWNSRVLSSVNAILTSCAGYYTLRSE